LEKVKALRGLENVMSIEGCQMMSKTKKEKLNIIWIQLERVG